jgi:uncharacterized protein YcaQ
MDCKAHRKTRHFEIKSLHFEQHGFDENRVISAFADAVSEFLCFQQCDTVSMVNMYPTNLTQNLRRTLAAKF